MARIIRASEVGEYCYCARAWWLHQIEGIEPQGHEQRARGEQYHARHGAAVRLSGTLRLVGFLLLLVGIVGIWVVLRG